MANEPLDHPSNWPTPLPPVQNLKTEEFLQEHAELAEELRAVLILFPSMFDVGRSMFDVQIPSDFQTLFACKTPSSIIG